KGAHGKGESRLNTEAEPVTLAIEESRGNLSEKTRTIARVVGRSCPAMVPSPEGLERHLHHGVGALAGGAGDEAYPAGIVLSKRLESDHPARLGGVPGAPMGQEKTRHTNWQAGR